jgi:adenosylhomocysteine nucleosidase
MIRIPCVLFALSRERMFFHHTYRIDQRMMCAPGAAFLCRARPSAVRTLPALVVETGVGAENTRQALDWLLAGPSHAGTSYAPSVILFAGFAGALDASLHVGDVVLAEEVTDLARNTWRGAVPGGGLTNVRSGRLLTVDRFIGDPAEKIALGAAHGALAVDMETAVCARLCHEHDVPWACLRVISDDVRRPLAREVAELVEESRVPLGRLLRTLMRRPGMIPQLWRLGRDTRYAARRLAAAAVEWLGRV